MRIPHKFLYLLVLTLSGCSLSPPKRVDQQAMGKELAAFQRASTASQYVLMHNRRVKNLFEFECFPELEACLERMAQSDPVETLCTPASALLELRKTQSNGTIPWMIYHSEHWVARPGHSGWAEMVLTMGCFDQGEDLCEGVGWNEVPPYGQGQTYLRQGLNSVKASKDREHGWPVLDYYQGAVTGGSRSLMDFVRDHPNEIALYALLEEVLQKSKAAQRAKHLQKLARECPTGYALLFTLQLRGARARLAPAVWDWQSLKTGFEKLLQEHPNALGVRNAYAVAAQVYEDRPLAVSQAALLGYHWDPDFWGSLRQYQDALGEGNDHHLDDSTLPALQLDKSFAEQALPEDCEEQAVILLEKGLWAGLETFLGGLPQPRQRYAAAEALQRGKEQTEASYSTREAMLRNWQSDRPESPQMSIALGGFYVSQAWLARGDGTADTVTPEGWKKFHERLENAAHFLKARVSDQMDINLLDLTITLCNAGGSFDRKVADELGLAAARRGLEGIPALEGYFYSLLPRWHGKPGDLESACNWLRQQTGNDDAYYVMADRAIWAEGGEEVLDPSNPSHVDWKRVVASYVAAAKAHRTNSHWAHVLVWDAFLSRQPASARELLPYLPKLDSLREGEWPIFLAGAREWASGKLDLAWGNQKYTFKAIGPKRQKVSARGQMGIAIESNKPLMFGAALALHVTSPPLTNRKGFQYTECVLVGYFQPREELTVELFFAPRREEEFQPGTYHLALYADGEVVHRETFEVTP